MLSRVFAVLAALLLVSAIAIATLTPEGQTLGQSLLRLDGGWLAWMKAGTPDWMWQWIELPLLLRPLWLLPACLGLVCGGLSASLNMGSASPSRRRS